MKNVYFGPLSSSGKFASMSQRAVESAAAARLRACIQNGLLLGGPWSIPGSKGGLAKMAQKVVSRFCERCGGEASAVAKKSNHFLHLILTCLTMGAWVFVWMALLGLDKALDAPRCTECGLIASKSIA